MMVKTHVRQQITKRLHADLIGPSGAEEISDRPSNRYFTGILYPQDVQLSAEDDDQLGLGVDEEEEDAGIEGEGVPLVSTLKPASAGISFAIQRGSDGQNAIDVRICCGTYKRFFIDDKGNELIDQQGDRQKARWRRTPHEVLLCNVELKTGSISLSEEGLKGLELYLQVTPVAETVTVTAALVNRNVRGETAVDNEERSFFQVELAVRVVGNAKLVARPASGIDLDDDSRSAALIYRNTQVFSVGHTCSATWEPLEGEVEWVRTTWIPECIVPAVSDRGDDVFEKVSKTGKGNIKPLSASWLSDATAGDLAAGLELLIDAYAEWINREEERIPSLPVQYRHQAKEHIKGCREGAERMADAVGLLSSDTNARTAFQLANRAMVIQHRWGKGMPDLEWRPFQLGFQLLTLASLADRSHKDRSVMDLLWFPTGGGKTEAYLGLIAFILFLRRLRRGKTDDGGGVAVIMRYTLRLLTTQQFQRAARMMSACEYLRRLSVAKNEILPDLGAHPFSIGLWVGSGATPNTLQEALKQQLGSKSTPEQLKECPCCGEPLVWKRTPKECRPYCNSKGCDLAGLGTGLELWTVDEDIYREAPSLIIGTIDKFAQIARRAETRVLFGLGTEHAPPDLIIQDELHLISGPLGTLSALYEVAIDELCTRDGVRPKIIGSTATIRRAREQIRALFSRDTYQFPPPGIDASNSCFAVYDQVKPGRLYLGVTTAGRSAKYTLQAVAGALLQSAANPSLTDEERDPYWTLVGYFNSLRELGGSLVLMQDDVPVAVNQYASRHGEPARKLSGVPAELTSRVPSREIPGILQDLDRKAGDSAAYDVLLASNMISVGIDIPRLGLMVVNGQPKSLAEYIQATSRVGRGGVPGIVITIFYNSRARDRSRYETFMAWHRTLYREVEATSVTPFASRAQDKALHAVLVSLVRHLVPGMQGAPILSQSSRHKAEAIAAIIEQRAKMIDPPELPLVSKKLESLLEEWYDRQDLRAYWDDYGNQPALMISAEQHAARMAGAFSGWDAPDGIASALWPTPNSMRDVEPGTPFILVSGLKRKGETDASE